MKKLMLTAAAITAAFALTAETYTPSTIPTSLSAPDVVPGEVNYQGLLRNPATGDKYVDGIYNLECRLYTQESGGTPIWGASYSVYVKDGYFNVMLGSSGAELSDCTYKSAELWKALWYKIGNRDLYLGVKPLEGPNNNALSSGDRKEIQPRQKLLTAPFAFRAHKAQYADSAPGNFKVAGNLDVSGNVNVASGKSLTLKNITASDSEVKLGNNRSSPANTTLQGARVLVEAGTALNVNSHGDATVTMDNGKTLNVSGGNINVQNTDVDIRTTGNMFMDGGGSLTVAGDEVRGKGKLKWNIKGRNDGTVMNYKPPVFIRRVNLHLAAGNKDATEDLAAILDVSWPNETLDKYSWAIIGYYDAFEAPRKLEIRKKASGTGYWVYCEHEHSIDSFTSITIPVDIMGIVKELTDDNR